MLQAGKPARPLRLFVDRDDQGVALQECVAHRYEMGRTVRGQRSKVSNLGVLQELAFPGFKHPARMASELPCTATLVCSSVACGHGTVLVMTRTVLAGDFGGTHFRAALVSEEGAVSAREDVPSPKSTDAAEVLAVVLDLLRGVAANGNPEAVCVATAGLVDSGAGRVGISPNIPGFRSLDIRTPLRDALDIPASVENDASAAALGEFRFGAGQGVRHLVHATLGTGIGGGLVIDRRLYRGAGGLAGEIGHMVVDPGGPQCNCGTRGCLEAVVSGVAFRERAKKLVENGMSLTLSGIVGDAEPSARHLTAAALAGDRLSEAEIRNAGHMLGIGIGGLVNVLNPDIVTLSGGLLAMGGMLLEPMREAIRSMAYGAATNTPIELSTLGDDAGLLGAAAAAFEHLDA